MPALAMASAFALPLNSTGPTQQLSATTSASSDESNILSIVFGILATLIALLSVVIAYRQLVARRRSSGASSPPVELDATGPYAYHPAAADEVGIEMAPLSATTSTAVQEMTDSSSQRQGSGSTSRSQPSQDSQSSTAAGGGLQGNMMFGMDGASHSPSGTWGVMTYERVGPQVNGADFHSSES